LTEYHAITTRNYDVPIQYMIHLSGARTKCTNPVSFDVISETCNIDLISETSYSDLERQRLTGTQYDPLNYHRRKTLRGMVYMIMELTG